MGGLENPRVSPGKLKKNPDEIRGKPLPYCCQESIPRPNIVAICSGNRSEHT